MAQRDRDRMASRRVDAKKQADDFKSGFDKSNLNVPEGVSLFQLKAAGTKRIDILEYEVGKGNPAASEGKLHYERLYYAHQGIGPDKAPFVCPRKTFGKACPICEYRAKLASDPEADEELVAGLAPKQRQLFNVIDLGERDKGVQIWEVSYHLFGKMLHAKIKAWGEDGDEEDELRYPDFAHFDDGLTLRLGIELKSWAGRNFYAVEDLEFRPRKMQYDEAIFEELHCLDDLIKEVSYDKLKAIFLQTEEEEDDDEDEKPKSKKGGKKPAHVEDDDEDDDEPAPKKKGKPPVEDDDDDEPAPKKKGPPTAKTLGITIGSMVEHEDFGECEVMHISGDGTSLKIKDEDGDVHKAIGADDVELIEDEPAPKKKSKPVDDDDEDEDDEPRPKSSSSKNSSKNSKSGRSKPSSDDDDDDDDEPAPKKWEDEDDDDD